MYKTKKNQQINIKNIQDEKLIEQIANFRASIFPDILKDENGKPVIKNGCVVRDINGRGGFRKFIKIAFKLLHNKDYEFTQINTQMINDVERIIYLNKNVGYYNPPEFKPIQEYIGNMPPRAGKTEIASLLVAYLITLNNAMNTEMNIIYTSFNQPLLSDIANNVKNLLQHPIYQLAFSKFRFVVLNEKEHYDSSFITDTSDREVVVNNKRIIFNKCSVLFATMGSAITGFGAGGRIAENYGLNGMLIIDDPNKTQDIYSKKMRKKTLHYCQQTLFTRANSFNVPIVIIQQRLHKEDLSGLLLKIYDSFYHYKAPLINDKNQVLLPQVYNIKKIEKLKKDPFTFAAQYQQDPILEQGNLFDPEKFIHNDEEIEEMFKKEWKPYLYIGVDTAVKTGEHNDYTAFVLIAKNTAKNVKWAVLDVFRQKVDTQQMVSSLMGFYLNAKQNYKGCTIEVYIEEQGNGVSLLEGIKLKARAEDVNMFVKGIRAVKGKVQRALNASIQFNDGRIILPTKANWLHNFKTELIDFNGDDDGVDDQVDAFTLAFNQSVEKHNGR